MTTGSRWALGFLLIVSSFTYTGVAQSAENAFEVKCVATDSTLYRLGKIERGEPGDEVTYLVDPANGAVTRTAIYNKSLPQEQGGGLQSDNSVYQIVKDGQDLLLGQRVIKAIGQVG